MATATAEAPGYKVVNFTVDSPAVECHLDYFMPSLEAQLQVHGEKVEGVYHFGGYGERIDRLLREVRTLSSGLTDGYAMF